MTTFKNQCNKHFSRLVYLAPDLKVTVLQQKYFKGKLQHETAELDFIVRFDSVCLALNGT